MGATIELEIEFEPPGIETALEVVPFQNMPAVVHDERERTQWEIAGSRGKLFRKPKWRWYGRNSASNLRLSAGNSWRHESG